MFEKIKGAILSKVLAALLPGIADKYEADIRRVALSINALLAALYTAIPLLPDHMEKGVSDNLDYLRDRYHTVLQFLKDYAGLDLKEYY